MIKKYKRTFVPVDFCVTDWASIQPFYDDLLSRDITSLNHLKKFLMDWSEIEGVLEEDAGWRYIRSSCDTTDAAATERYVYFIADIEPYLYPVTDALNKKVLLSKEVPILRQEIQFDIFFRKIEDNLRCYRKENIPLQTDIQLHAKKYAEITGAMMIELESKEITLQQAAVYLESTDRTLRKTVYEKIQQRRLQDKDTLHELYTHLVQQRHKIALNAGFNNFRDYAFVSMHRFDYTPADCFTFHTAVKEAIVPLINELAADRKKQLGVDLLQPFDLFVDPQGRMPLHPFSDEKELISKTIAVFEQLDPFLGNCLHTMKEMGHLDLTSRKGKAPGGYNYPLDETGVPFIFMNATSTCKDLITIFHEGGHAVHAFLVHDLLLNAFKHCPSEIAELASMSMELLTMPYWHIFFNDEEALKRAKKEHLIGLISRLSWIAAIDAFQHWVYENPYHTVAERTENWNRICMDFSEDLLDWSGYELCRDHLWQKQLHLFELPFYYIEYGIAQLGAIGVWKNAQEDPKKGLKDYLAALQLGYTTSIPNVYKTAGVSFDFNKDYIHALVAFIRKVCAKL